MGFTPFVPLDEQTSYLLIPSNDTSGVTDTLNIQGVINQGGQLGPGTFYVTSLTMISGARLAGSGPSTILKSAVTGSNAANLITGSAIDGFEISDMTINGNLANRTPAGLETTQCNIYLTSCTDGLIHDLIVRNAASNGICLAGCSYVTVRGNVCYGNQRNGIALTWSGNSYCTVVGNACYSQVQWSGIAIDGSPYNTVAGNNCYGNGITGANAAAGVWIDGGSDGCTISGNACTGNRGSGIRIGDTGSAILGPSHITVAGNTCHLNYRHGIESVTSIAAAITGNNILDNSQESANFYDGIHLSSIDGTYHTINASVTGNIVTTNHAHGVNLADGNTTGCRIVGNNLTGNSSPLALNVTATIVQNAGPNPIGYINFAPAVAASGVAVTNTTSFDVTVYVACGAGVTVTEIDIGGTATGVVVAAATTSSGIRVPEGQTITLTYAGGAPTWTWFGD